MNRKRNAMPLVDTAKEPIWRPIVKDDQAAVVRTDDGEKLSLWQRFQLTFGVRTVDMAQHPNTPPSIPLNVTTIGTWVVIIATIAGGFYWSYQLGQTNGKQQQIIDQQQLEIQHIKTVQEKEHDVKITRQADSQEEPSPTPQKGKK